MRTKFDVYVFTNLGFTGAAPKKLHINDRCEAYCSSHKLTDNHIGLHILVYDLFNKHKNNNEYARNKT